MGFFQKAYPAVRVLIGCWKILEKGSGDVLFYFSNIRSGVKK
jgi:hypothetical protein